MLSKVTVRVTIGVECVRHGRLLAAAETEVRRHEQRDPVGGDERVGPEHRDGAAGLIRGLEVHGAA